MADYDFRGQEGGYAIIAATKTFHLDAGARYVAELGGNDGGASAVNLKYEMGDGTYVAYPDDPGDVGAAIEIVAPSNGVVQVAITGGSSVAVRAQFRKIAR